MTSQLAITHHINVDLDRTLYPNASSEERLYPLMTSFLRRKLHVMYRWTVYGVFVYSESCWETRTIPVSHRHRRESVTLTAPVAFVFLTLFYFHLKAKLMMRYF
ncbi:hypothetical protein BHE74_00013818 [Ensete ventricosum]|nr:hypothetical protein GW17_00021982 [Ensete ventricosum]RWW77979.1 hypothetical protein BHE74_00013818 [Ensete ventricosum]RZR98041.1 hypothetical protein BHM03_00027345 [Ensete ventricosum]